jgi:hypothetical protein
VTPLIAAPPRPAATTLSRSAAWRWAALLAVGWLVQAALRAWLSRSQVVPVATPDEDAYLIAARILAGGQAANFSWSTLYPVGYPLLLTPVFWLTHNPVTAYHATLIINALISALLLPLAYVAGRRLGLDRWSAYAVAFVTASLPAALFYSEYAMTDAIYPVLVLAWLLCTHSWLCSSGRRQYVAAAGSGLLAGYLYAVHSRGLVILACYLLLIAYIVWRRLGAWRTAVAAGIGLVVVLAPSWLLNRYLAQVMYPSGARSLSGEAVKRLDNAHGAVLVTEMGLGQLWRFALDGWGVAALGFVAACYLIVRRAGDKNLRIIGALAVAVTLLIAATAPAALPPDEGGQWASGRYLDCMICVFFIAGCALVLQADRRTVLRCAIPVVPVLLLTGAVVDAYAGSSVTTAGFTGGFTFGEPAVLTQSWTSANVMLVSLAGVVVLALVVVGAWFQRPLLLAGLAVLSLVAVFQLTSHVSVPSQAPQEADTSGLLASTGLRPGEHLAIGYGLNFSIWMPQAYAIWWTQLEFFHAGTSPPPANASVVEMYWPAGQPAQASWPTAPAGWEIVAESGSAGWVAWRHAGLRVAHGKAVAGL